MWPLVSAKRELGKGRIIMGDSIDVALNHSAVRREVMVDQGIHIHP